MGGGVGAYTRSKASVREMVDLPAGIYAGGGLYAEKYGNQQKFLLSAFVA